MGKFLKIQPIMNKKNSLIKSLKSPQNLISKPKKLLKNKKAKTNWQTEKINYIEQQLKIRPILLESLPDDFKKLAIKGFILLGGVKNGKWFIEVENSQLAHKLRFLSSEIEKRLAEKLRYPPKLSIKINPFLAQNPLTRQTKTPTTQYQKTTPKQSEKFLENFINQLQTKLNIIKKPS